MRSRRFLLRTIVAGACLTAVVAIVALLAGNLDQTSGRVLLTTTAISVFGVLAVPAQMLLDRGTLPVLARLSGALTGATFLLTCVVIWTPDLTTNLWRAWGVGLTLTLSAAQVAAVEARRRDSDSHAIRRLAGLSMVTAGSLAVLATVGILGPVASGGYFRLTGVLAVLDVLSLVIVAALRRGESAGVPTHRMRLDGRLVEAPGRDFAAAVAAAIREQERQGTPVKRVERA